MADILFYNGTIITMEDSLYAEALLIADSHIAKVGTKKDLLAMTNNSTQMIDLNGHTLMPSFIDAHSHFSGYANSLLQVSLEEAVSFEEIAESLKAFIKKNKVPPGTWVLARSYDHNNLVEKKHPDKSLLDQACPNNPCVISHQSGHMGVMNTLALKELHIDADTPSPEGGLIEKINGEPTGFLEENAYVNYIKSVPMASQEDFFAALTKAQENYLSYGITTVQEGMVVEQLADILNYLRTSGTMKLDLIGYADVKSADQILAKFSSCIKKYDNHIKIGGYKAFLDGSPQGRTAWMLSPYKNAEDGYCGYPIYQDAQFLPLIQKALNDDMQLLVHCNGDAAAEQYLTQYQIALTSCSKDTNIRPVIIHAQLLQPEQLKRVQKLHMIPSFFVAHVYYWGDIHIQNFGLERASKISPAASAVQLGIPFTFHQDSPVIEPNMLETIWCAVNRITKHGIKLGEEEAISPLEALKAVTTNAAYQYFEEDIKGSLREGKLADLIILDQNPLTIDPGKIKDIKVCETWKEGHRLYQNPELKELKL